MSERGPVAYHAAALARNLLAGVRLALFLPLRALDFRASAGHLAVLVGFNFALWILASWVRAGFAGQFYFGAVPGYLGTVTLLLFAALLVAGAYRAPERIVLVAIALASSDALFELAALALPAVVPANLGLVLPSAFFAWVWVTALRAVIVCNGLERPQLYQAAFAVSAMMALAMLVFPQSEPWVEPYEPESAALTDERLFHLQGMLIERALADIAPGEAGVPELYFVGFAPDASQDVFLRELRAVRRLFDERLATAGRSIALASSQDALDQWPIATATNLSRALGRVGEVMNAEEDVLVLYITAHGDSEHRLSASQPPLSVTALTPVFLHRLLAESGARFRVVVISACFSGGYVDALRDANTMVITASAADRHSFGCEQGRDFTYFGRAFSEGLQKTGSFDAAFEAAKHNVAAQETAEGLEPSQPQSWTGEAVAERLRTLKLHK